jgi:hypothetical protein
MPQERTRPWTASLTSHSADQKAHGLVIGANVGGLSYVGPDGLVHRTRTASPDEPELDKVADGSFWNCWSDP